MRNIKLKISYHGKYFYGWQKQPTVKTVQGELEKALKKILKIDIHTDGSGRTDAGVHAIEQVANFKIDKEIPNSAFLHGLNSILPKGVRVQEVEDVDLDFHSRKSSIKKTYKYQIYNSWVSSPLYDDFYHWVKYPLDLEKMKEATKFILGKHDFISFAAAKNSTKTTIRSIYNAKWEQNDKILTFTITGDGFLMKMVRNIVGTIIEVGLNRYEPNMIPIILNKKNRKYAGKTAPASGLFLKKVYYEKYN